MARSTKTELLSGLPVEKREAALEVDQALKSAGFECYLVGGVVRDLVMGRSPGDIDIATNAHPDRVVGIFRRTIPTGLKHGTVTVLLRDQAFEVTTYRSESTYSDARRPDSIEFADTLEEDLKRRDFTVNALAYDAGTGVLVDEHDGLSDIGRKLIRTIGSPFERFFEDGLRPVRACRFCAVLGFSLDPGTYNAISHPDVLARTAKVAVERFSDELWKGFQAAPVSSMIAPLETSGMMGIFLPFSGSTTGDHLARLDALFPAIPTVRMAFWWQCRRLVETQAIESTGRRLKFSHKQIRDLLWFSALMSLAAGEEKITPLEKRRFLSGLKQAYDSDGLEFLRDANVCAPHLSSELESIFSTEPLTAKDLAIDGRDLQELGFSGPPLGQVLRTLLDEVISGTTINIRENLLSRAVALHRSVQKL